MISHAVLQLGADLRQWEPALANHLWQSTVFAAAAWLLTLALKQNQARARHWIWMAASLKFILPFALLVALGAHFAKPSLVAPPSTLMVYAVEDMSAPFVSPVQSSSTLSAPQANSGAAELLPLAVATVWMAGFVAVLVLWGVRWRRVAKSMRSAAPEVAGRELKALRRIERAVNLSAPIELRTLDEAMEPGVFGMLRPVLLWPGRISDRLDDAQLDAVLAHEVCHVRRRDNLTAALHMLVEAAFWFHPMVWWVGARLVEERERACDEDVLLLCDRPAIYAQSILKVCEFCVESPLVCLSGVTGADLKRRVFQIMTKRVGPKLSWAKKALLTAVAVVVVAAPVFFGGMRLIPIYGQVFHATGPLTSYEVVAIKPSKDDAHGASTNGEQTHYLVTARMLVQFAYGIYSPPKLNNLDVLGGPQWINSDVFDIVGKMPATEFVQEQNLTRNRRHERRQLMEQSLLAERFKLRMHTEMRDQPVYALTVIKGGPKMTPSRDATGSAYVNPNPGSADPKELKRGLIVRAKPGALEMTVKGMTLDMLVNALMAQKETAGKPVVNQTGLTGAYDFTLVWGVEQSASPDSKEPEEPPLMTAIQQQLGLKLIQTKGPAEVVVIDHIEKPSLDGAEAAAN